MRNDLAGMVAQTGRHARTHGGTPTEQDESSCRIGSTNDGPAFCDELLLSLLVESAAS